MKKMLDELKKLDVDYDVPENFSKKVMEKIKSESVSPKANVSYLRKYVIPWASAVAVFVVAVIVTAGGGSIREKSMNNSVMDYDSDFVASPSISSVEQEGQKETIGATVPQSVVNGASKAESFLDKFFDDKADAAQSAATESTKNDFIYNENEKVDDRLLVDKIIEVLNSNNILLYEVDENLIVIEDMNIEFIKEILKDYKDDIDIYEKENFVKIELK